MILAVGDQFMDIIQILIVILLIP